MKFSKKTTVAALAVMASTLLLSGCGQVKIGYIDGARVTKEAPQIKAIVDEGNQKLEAAQKESEEDFKKKTEENPNMSAEDAQKLQSDAQRKLQGLNQSYALQLRQRLDVALGEVSKEKKLDAIVNNSEEQPTAVSGAIDITDEVISKLQ